MHGDGIRPGTTASNPSARLLEMTRVLALQGRRPSGVDRVCLAYLRAVLADDVPCFGLVRTGLGYVLLDQVGMQVCLDCIEGRREWPAPDVISRLRHRDGSPRRVPDTLARQICVARARPRRLGHMLRRHVPTGVVYINVDQTTLTERVLRAVKSVPKAGVTVFLHDTIPLDYPQYQTPKSVEKLAAILKRCAVHADHILTNSAVSAEDIARHMTPLGRVPKITAAHLGVEDDFFEIANNGCVPGLENPYFAFVGTIEPRKNLTFVLDLWEHLADQLPAEDMPHLAVCGRRGWEDAEVLARLDKTSIRNKFLFEFNDLSDSQLAAVLSGASGLLFPSHAEGFGLPPVEAAALGVPVICQELPVLREILGDYPIYASVSDVYQWETIIRSLTKAQAVSRGAGTPSAQSKSPPTWEAHFNTVLRVT